MGKREGPEPSFEVLRFSSPRIYDYPGSFERNIVARASSGRTPPISAQRKGPGDLCGTLSGLEVTIPKASDFASFRADSLACSILCLPTKQER